MFITFYTMLFPQEKAAKKAKFAQHAKEKSRKEKREEEALRIKQEEERVAQEAYDAANKIRTVIHLSVVETECNRQFSLLQQLVRGYVDIWDI